ncbi:Tetratricopeptide repeat-containing protein [Shimia gijangensis]|uniref:Tetratricopeptide repeat-containing protein n=1 Tax=Shimia gijangensis TaxID=1470563 RepID=A0A1M6CYU6_9RHOB|nr:tetratricopeptide repeat protein [Shimia gijangensis]SHI65898.1 Tetratricopeptide repeat-containing protein [Shimia gijangensis]
MKSALRPAIVIVSFALAACNTGGLGASSDSPYAPTGTSNKQAVDGLEVGDRLMTAGEYELALDAYIRAATQHGMTADVLTSLGSANLGLGRLGQAEKLFQQSLDKDETRADTWNNLGVVRMEKRQYAEAEQIFRKAYALDDGESDSIRENLRLALAKMENPTYDEGTSEYKLVRRGSGDYIIRTTP